MKQGLLIPGLLLAACAAPEHAGWKRVDVEAFSLLLPDGVVEVPVKPIDSYVRHFRIGAIELGFDYGQWSDPLDDPKPRRLEWTVIDGRRAKIVYMDPKEETKTYCAAVHVPEVRKADEPVKLTVYLSSPEPIDPDLAERIFRSLRFAARR